MRCIIGDVQRRAILDSIPHGGRMLEWGAGGSTVWFASHLPPGATLTSIEHDLVWSSRVAAEVNRNPRVRVLPVPSEGPLGRNATIEEESQEPLHQYVHAVDGERFDVILVDGYARSACLEQAASLLKPQGRVFLHDAQRSWYDQAKAPYHDHGSIGSCPDYPVPHLWYGGLNPVDRTSTGEMPVIVSYFTKGTEYESLAARLADSCETLDLEYHLISRAPFGSWEEHCAAKAEVCLRAWQELRRPILWVDADAIINRPPNLLRGCGADFAVHRWDRWQIASGTIFFGQSALAEALLQEWVERCRRHPTTWDQVHLDFAWEHVSCVSPLHTIWLPRAYCQIYDRRSEEGHTTVIEHYQASRRHRRSSSADGAPAPSVTAALFHARRAARPRRSRLPGPDSQDFAKELEAERRLESITYSLEDTVALAAHSGVRTPVEGQIAMTTNAPLITCDR